MDNLQIFVREAEAELASVRGSLLIVAQSGDMSELVATRRTLDRLKNGAQASGHDALAALTSRCEAEINGFANTPARNNAHAALDIVAQMEAELWAIPTLSDGFDFDVGGFVDASFANLVSRADDQNSDDPVEEFEIDDETLDIFRAEAEELLANISVGLKALAVAPDDQAALWDIRRNAHTFKGAAGIVGMMDASRIAHRMEDLLDKMVETHREAGPEIFEFLEQSASSLAAIVAVQADENEACLKASYDSAISLLSSPVIKTNGATATGHAISRPPDTAKPAAAPIVRVSLDRLDEIINLSHRLSINRSALAETFAGLTSDTLTNIGTLVRVGDLFETGGHLADEIQAKLRKIRMVKFSTLATRLSRAVHVTCLDENKKATVEIENGDVEIDTQIIDALIEPLLHLLKNAVVHGIETPETRRFIGKPERGNIRIQLDAEEALLAMSISDDGGGISIPKLKAEAVAKGLIDSDKAAAMDDGEAIQLIFDRGLTTAEKLDLNAGRGIGMGIVKESIEMLGGCVLVESDPQRGTTFKIRMPLAVSDAQSVNAEIAARDAEPLPQLVLVVDDSSSVRHQTARLVKEAGFRVITAENGAEVLELLLSGEWEPDLILSDVEMPQVDGWALLEYLKTDEHFGHIPIVMVTSLDTDEHRNRAFDLGAADFLVKPFSRPDFDRIWKSIGLDSFASPLAANRV